MTYDFLQYLGLTLAFAMMLAKPISVHKQTVIESMVDEVPDVHSANKNVNIMPYKRFEFDLLGDTIRAAVR